MGTSILLLAAAATISRSPWTLTSPHHGRAAAAGFQAAQARATEAWSGFLMDDECHAANATARCDVTDDTARFGIQAADGRYYRLDSAQKVRAALKAATGRNTGADGLRVTVTGAPDGDAAIRVAAVQVQ